MKKREIRKRTSLKIIIFVLVIFSFIASALNQGEINLNILSQKIIIHNPENTTYEFENITGNKIILNATFGIQLTNWSYNLTNLKKETFSTGKINSENGFWIYEEIEIEEGKNILYIFGKDINEIEHISNVSFIIKVPNIAPKIKNLSYEFYACEGDEFSQVFSTTDENWDPLYPDITPKNPFFIREKMPQFEGTLISEIYSRKLIKNDVGEHIETISISDGQYIDSKQINITIIEINNPPTIEQIGTKTIWIIGEEKVFNETIKINDTETGLDPNNFELSISFEETYLFNISSEGEMYFEANSSFIGIHNITLCAKDNPLEDISPNISLCPVGAEEKETCINFSITITDQNRPPQIINRWPEQNMVNITQDLPARFNITKYDPDGTIPDSYWYLDGEIIKTFYGEEKDSLSYYFNCNLNGLHFLKAEITDGLLNNSFIWEINLLSNRCSQDPSDEPTRGGGGGGGKVEIPSEEECEQNIACGEWGECKNVDNPLNQKEISLEEYENIKKICNSLNIEEKYCGFQKRKCQDLNNCPKSIPSSKEIRQCYFTTDPNCFDNIKNCHNGSCEFLIDCGGPCLPCPTCSDGIQNPGEEGIDCGGHCPNKCETKKIQEEKNKLFKFYLWYMFLLIILIILLIVYIIKKYNHNK